MSDLTSSIKYTTDPETGLPLVIKSSVRADHEAHVLAQCAHPAVVRLISHSPGILYLEQLAGEPLSHAHVDHAAEWLHSLLGTLSYIHSCGWVHNDLCPSNIIATAAGPVIIDFDAASPIGSTEPQSRGTVHYMAPERFANLPATPESDLYSLGITFYEVLTGHLPFDSVTRLEIIAAHHLHHFTPLPETTPEPLRTLIHTLTARDPTQRYVHTP